MAAVCPTTRRQTGPWQQHRLPQLRHPVVHAIGSPQVAAVLWLLLPSDLILDRVSTPTNTLGASRLTEVKWSFPSMEVDGCGKAGHRPLPDAQTNWSQWRREQHGRHLFHQRDDDGSSANLLIAPTSTSGRPRHRLAASRSSPLALVAHSPDPRWGLDACEHLWGIAQDRSQTGLPGKEGTDL